MAGLHTPEIAVIVGLAVISVAIFIAVLVATIGVAFAVRRERRLGTLPGLPPDG